MPDVYQPDLTVPELGGAVKGGITIVIHRREEVEGLLAVCELAGRPPEDPMHAVFRALNESALDLAGWIRWKRRLHLPSPQSFEDTELEDVDELHDVLSLANDIWQNQRQDADKLCLALIIADPASSSYPVLEIEGSNPLLVLHKGSIIVNLIKGRWRAAVFAVCLALGGGATPSARALHLIEQWRREALQEPGVEPLKELTALSAADLVDKKAVIVFVHGLLSIDVGHFDALIKRLKSDTKLLLTGFPHNTLGPISRNARDLARALSGAIGQRPLLVALVCHSRGGLVARQAAEFLYQEDAKKSEPVWNHRLRLCLTFGTPHLGADLAEAPSEFVGAFVAHASARATRSIASLVDVLSYRCAHDGFPGIEELKPEGDFLGKLEELEKGVSPNVKIVAIGGRARITGAQTAIARRVFGDSDHDLVVRLHSSLPGFLDLEQRIETDCNHFEYFDEASQKGVLDQVSARVKKELLEGAGPAEIFQ
jgi:hypothetical protein